MGKWKMEQKNEKKDPTTSIRKHGNELKVHKNTVRIAIKQDLNPDLNPLDYAIWGILEDKTNATSQLLIHLRLLLRKNGIESLKNLFWRHENHFKGMLIQ